MATNNLEGLYTSGGTEIHSQSWQKQLRNKSGIPLLMADSIAVTYTTSVNEDGDTVANFTTLDEKLEALENSITDAGNVVVDTALSSSSTNPVQNKVINAALAAKASTSTATTSANGLMSTSDKSKLDAYPVYSTLSNTLSTKELTANKVTSVSSTSTDTQYPSAKALYTSYTSLYDGLLSKVSLTQMANASTNGLMSSSAYTKLSNIPDDYEYTDIYVDSKLTSDSTNPVQSCAIYNAIKVKNVIKTKLNLSYNTVIGLQLDSDGNLSLEGDKKTTVIVTLDPNGGVFESSTSTNEYTKFNKEITIGTQYGANGNNLPKPKKSGYNFDGWYYAEEDLNGDGQINVCDLSLVTQIICGNYNFDSVQDKNMNVTNINKVTGIICGTSEPTWTQITNTTTCTRTIDHTLTAKWSVNALTITLDANGGTCSTTEITRQTGKEYFSSSDEFVTPTRSGYKFDYWYYTNEDANGDGKINVSDINMAISSMTGNADFDTKQRGSEQLINTIQRVICGNISASNIIISAGTKTKTGTLITRTKDHTLTAHWTALPTITIDANGGYFSNNGVKTTSKIIIFETGQKYADKGLPTPSRTGYDFVGWYYPAEDINGDGVVNYTDINCVSASTATSGVYEYDTEENIKDTLGSVISAVTSNTITKKYVVDGTTITE